MSPWLVIPWFEAHDILPLVDEESNAWEIPIGSTTIPVQPFGVLVATGVLLAVRWGEEVGKKRGLHPAVVSDFATHIVFGGFIGAFFLNALFYEPSKLVPFFSGIARLIGSIPGALFAGKGFQTEGLSYLGLSSYGGFLGAVAGLLLWRRKYRWSPLAVADIGAFTFPLGWLFGRTGCFITHDHPGMVSHFFLAVDNYGGKQAPRHDLGLYEVFWSAAIIALFLALDRKRRPTGLYLVLLCVLYAPTRFFLDFLRAPPELGGDVRYLGLTPGQYGSLALLVAGLSVFRWISTHPTAPIPPEAAWPEPNAVASDAASPHPKGSHKPRKKPVAAKKKARRSDHAAQDGVRPAPRETAAR